MNRTLPTLIIALALMLTGASTFAQPARKIPVILDTDIGDDIDDTWALALALRSPEIDLKLVVTDFGNSTFRARCAAKMLTLAGRADIPIGLGLNDADKPGRQSPWIEDFPLSKFTGKVHKDGVAAMIDLIMSSEQPVTLICIGPVPNIAEALRREPKIATKAKFVGMHGSVRKGYGGGKPAPEWNVKADAKACKQAFTAAWDMTITPLDTCGLVRLEGPRYAALRDSKDPIAAAVIDAYRAWNKTAPGKNDPETRSTTLYDTVAVYLSFSTDLLEMEKLPLIVTDTGMTSIDEKAGKPINTATKWKDRAAFEDLLIKRLSQP